VFLGHLAVGFAAKTVAPRATLGTAVMGVLLADLLWPLLLLAGLEEVRIAPGITAVTPLDFVSYPISHSLLADLLWGAALGGAYYALRRDGRGAAVLAGCVISHWVLDFVSHRPDMPLVPGGARYGLGLWDSVPATVAVELVLLAAGLLLYLRATRAADRLGSVALWTFVLFLLAAYAANLLGPPPPDVRTLAIAANASWLLVAWAYWIDRHRRERTA
jgi:hypothetical protein